MTALRWLALTALVQTLTFSCLSRVPDNVSLDKMLFALHKESQICLKSKVERKAWGNLTGTMESVYATDWWILLYLRYFQLNIYPWEDDLMNGK